MAQLTLSWVQEDGRSPLVLSIPCWHDPEFVLIKLATFDGEEVMVWEDGSYSHDRSDFCQFVGPYDHEAAANLQALGQRLDSPPVADGTGYWRYRLRCGRPLCGVDPQPRAKTLFTALSPILKLLFSHGRRGELTLDEAGTALGVPLTFEGLLRRVSA